MKSETGSQSILGLFGMIVSLALALVLGQAAGVLVEQRQLGNLANAVALDAADWVRVNPESNQTEARALATTTLFDLANQPESLKSLEPRLVTFRMPNTRSVLVRVCADNRFSGSPITYLLSPDLRQVCIDAAATNVAQN